MYVAPGAAGLLILPAFLAGPNFFRWAFGAKTNMNCHYLVAGRSSYQHSEPLLTSPELLAGCQVHDGHIGGGVVLFFVLLSQPSFGFDFFQVTDFVRQSTKPHRGETIIQGFLLCLVFFYSIRGETIWWTSALI